MIETEAQLRVAMLADSEDERLEFKAARTDYDFEKLTKYCCALANEGGGHIILGVTDKKPRYIVGSAAFADLGRTKGGLFERLRWKVAATEITTADGRVVVVYVPARPTGRPLEYRGAYWMRAGEDLVPMSLDQIKVIIAEGTPDFSAEIVPGVGAEGLDAPAVAEFRRLWHRKSRNDDILSWSDAQLLENAELTVDGQLTYAGLILLGGRAALGRHLSQAELVFEYRSAPASVEYQQRHEYRQGFLSWFDDLWNRINLRNDVQQFQDGLLRFEVPTFGEESVREAILNAICHRDYQDAGSVFVKQYPRHMDVISPGGFPSGITPANILTRQKPRNRRVAEALAKCGFVERSGQGVDKMFQESIRSAKPLPDYVGSDPYRVMLTLRGEVTDAKFLRFLERVGQETLATFSTQDFLVLDLVHREDAVPEMLRPSLRRLLDAGIVEPLSRQRYILSRRFHAFLGQKGVYTRKKGLDREAQRQLLLQHIRTNDGSPMADLLQVLPNLSRMQVKALLAQLRDEGLIHLQGERRTALWHFGAPAPEVEVSGPMDGIDGSAPENPKHSV